MTVGKIPLTPFCKGGFYCVRLSNSFELHPRGFNQDFLDLATTLYDIYKKVGQLAFQL